MERGRTEFGEAVNEGVDNFWGSGCGGGEGALVAVTGTRGGAAGTTGGGGDVGGVAMVGRSGGGGKS